MLARAPNIVVLAGPNGAGKSTAARVILREVLGIAEFVNADVIARGLSGCDPEGAALARWSIMFPVSGNLAGNEWALPWRARWLAEPLLPDCRTLFDTVTNSISCFSGSRAPIWLFRESRRGFKKEDTTFQKRQFAVDMLLDYQTCSEFIYR